MAQKNKKSAKGKGQSASSTRKGFPVLGVTIIAVVVIVAAVGVYVSSSSKSGSGTGSVGSQMQTSQATPESDTAVKTVAAADAKKLIDQGAQLIDVRTKDEYDWGHIKGAKLISVDVISEHVSELSKDKPVLVYCASGVRSAQAASYLASNGFKKVYDLSGGIARWNYEIVK